MSVRDQHLQSALKRPLRERPFWNTETSTCWNGLTNANGYREPGFCRANSWIPIVLGGEANLYWLWRAHWSGHEVMHGSVVSSSGRPLHIMGEVKEVAAGLRAAGQFINGTRPVTQGVALHFSELVWWMFEFQPMVNGFNYGRQMIEAAYKPLHDAHVIVDVIDPSVALDDYRFVFTPFLLADVMKYSCLPFGNLEEWVKIHCLYEIPADPHEFTMRWNDGRETTGSIWYNAFELNGADSLATYTEGPLEGLTAVSRTQAGRGQIVVLGTMPHPDDMRQLMLDLGLQAAPGVTNNLLTVPRAGQMGTGMIVVELENKPAMVTLDHPMIDLISGQQYDGIVDLAP